MEHRTNQWHFRFDHVLHNATQDAVYSGLCSDVVAAACSGQTGAVLAYGQTGSGKSCTMMGDPQSFRGRGVIPRALAQVFAHIAAKPEADYAVSVSYLELYGDRLRDLLVLADATGSAAPGSLSAGLLEGRRGAGATAASASLLTAPNPVALGQFEVLEDATHGTLVRGLTQVPCHSEEAALSALFAAETARTTAQHALNARSNRAHAIFTVHLQQRNRLGGGRERILSSKLHLVDLAGSERLKKTMGMVPLGDSPQAQLQAESLAINKSLAVLESCVAALAARGGGGGHIPYRSSKLTHILKDALGGGRHACNSVIIACVWPEARHLDETVSTLRLAHRWAGLGARGGGVGEGEGSGGGGGGGEDGPAQGAVILDAEVLLQRLARENAQLRLELQMHDALADRSGSVVYGEFTPEQQARVAAQLGAFVRAEGDGAEYGAVPIESVAHMRELLRQCKILIKTAGLEAEEALRSRFTLVPKGAAEGSGSGSGGGSGSAGGGDASGGASGGGVGALDASSGGVGLGLAAASSRPRGGLGGLLSGGSGSPGGYGSEQQHQQHQHQHFEGRGSPGSSGVMYSTYGSSSSSSSSSSGGFRATGQLASPLFSPDLNAAWRQFKVTPGLGAEGAAAVHAAKGAHAAARAAVSAKARAVNAVKARVDALAASLAEVKARSSRSASPSTLAAGEGSGAAGSKGGKGGALCRRAPAPLPFAGALYSAAPCSFPSHPPLLLLPHPALLPPLAYNCAAHAAAAHHAHSTPHDDKPLVEEEYRVAAELAAAKAEYRAAYEAWGRARDGAAAVGGEVSSAVGRMLSEFETWYAANTGRLPALDRGGAGGGSGGGGGGGGRGAGGGDDVLDEGEAFDRMEMERVTSHEPDAGAYFSASRKLRHMVATGSSLNARPLASSPTKFTLSPTARR